MSNTKEFLLWLLHKSSYNNNNEKKLENNEDETNIKENLEVSISEMDLVIQQLRSCFNPRAGTQIIGDEMIKISAKIDRGANVRKDTVQIIDTNISKSNPYSKSMFNTVHLQNFYKSFFCCHFCH